MIFFALVWFMIGAIDLFVALQTVVIDDKMDKWNTTTIFGGAMTSRGVYESMEMNSICQCRMVCDVNPNCTLASAILDTSASKVDCRLSTEKDILQTAFTKTNYSVTFYKRVHKFCPANSGIFFWPETEPMTMTEAKSFCENKGGRLAILNNMDDYYMALEAVKHAASDMEPREDHLMLDLQRPAKGGPFVWGNGKDYAASRLDESVGLDFNSQLGIGIKTDTKLKEFDISKAYGFLCQYNPLNLDW